MQLNSALSERENDSCLAFLFVSGPLSAECTIALELRISFCAVFFFVFLFVFAKDQQRLVTTTKKKGRASLFLTNSIWHFLYSF